MLKKLRNKFILTNMVFVGVLLIIILVASCINTYDMQIQEIDRTLQEPLSSEDYQEGKFGFLTSMLVLADNDGDIRQIVTRGATMDDSKLKYAVAESLSGDETKGLIKDMKLFYERMDVTKSDKLIVLVDASRMIAIMQRTVTISVIIFFSAMVLVFFISKFIAGQAISPIQESWDKQKKFIANASHELKTPITVILANSGILKDRKESTISQESQWVDSTMAEAEHMKKLVENMLFLAKSDAADVKVEKEKVNLKEMTETDILHFEPLAYEKGVEMISQIDEDVTVEANPTQMKQLLHILLDNAIKYVGKTEEGEAIIEVKLKGGVKPQLSVKNTGKAIDMEEQQHLFDRFYRGDKSRTRDTYGDSLFDEMRNADDTYGGGYGLGLAIAKTIAEKHGADIAVRSDLTAGPNGMEGTEFTVTF